MKNLVLLHAQEPERHCTRLKRHALRTRNRTWE
jgi:hypothetical protein